jgi:hypothetical protein
MGPDASTSPPGLRIERRAETNRLAKEFQAQAYEELVPSRRRNPTPTAAPVPAAGARTTHHPNSEKGVAA